MTDNIRQLVSTFLAQKIVDYALLINGVWGAGKTFFVQNSLVDVFKEFKMSPVYVSLNGVNRFEEVAAQIVFGTNWSATKTVASSFLLPFAFKHLPDKSASAFVSLLKKISEKKSQGWLSWLKTNNDLSPKKHVIILDDIERVANLKANLVPIMGRIFDEFIFKGYHVIFVGDESQIKFEKYTKEKEKYIRRTVKFTPDIDSVINTIVSSYKGIEERHAKRCSDDLKQFAKSFAIDNIRTIRRILDDFILLVCKVNDEAGLSNVGRLLFYNMAPLANELSAGRLKASNEADISSLQNIETQRYAVQTERLYGSSELHDNEESQRANKQASYVEQFISRYDGVLPVKWMPCEVVIEYELNGCIDEQKLNTTVMQWLPKTIDKYRQSLDLIWGYDTLDDEQFLASYPIVMEGIKNGMYSAEWVMLACGLVSVFTKKGWIDIDCDMMVKDAVKALKKRWSEYPEDYINPMILHNRQEDFLQPVVDAIQEETNRRKKKSAEEDVSKFLAALAAKDKESTWAFLPRNQSWLIFDKIVKAEKVKEFCDISNWALALIMANLKDGAVFIRPSSHGAIERIVQELEDAIKACDNKKTPVRKDRLEELRTRFAERLDTLESKCAAGQQKTNGLTNG